MVSLALTESSLPARRRRSRVGMGRLVASGRALLSGALLRVDRPSGGKTPRSLRHQPSRSRQMRLATVVSQALGGLYSMPLLWGHGVGLLHGVLGLCQGARSR